MANVFSFYVNEIGEWIDWLASWNLYGVPFLFYIMGFVIIGAVMDFIFG